MNLYPFNSIFFFLIVFFDLLEIMNKTIQVSEPVTGSFPRVFAKDSQLIQKFLEQDHEILDEYESQDLRVTPRFQQYSGPKKQRNINNNFENDDEDDKNKAENPQKQFHYVSADDLDNFYVSSKQSNSQFNIDVMFVMMHTYKLIKYEKIPVDEGDYVTFASSASGMELFNRIMVLQKYELIPKDFMSRYFFYQHSALEKIKLEIVIGIRRLSSTLEDNSTRTLTTNNNNINNTPVSIINRPSYERFRFIIYYNNISLTK